MFQLEYRIESNYASFEEADAYGRPIFGLYSTAECYARGSYGARCWGLYCIFGCYAHYWTTTDNWWTTTVDCFSFDYSRQLFQLRHRQA